MTNRLTRVSLIVASTFVAGALAAPAFGQSYGAMPRGACMKSARTATSTPPAQVRQQPIHDVAYAAPVRETQRPRRARGFGSPF